MLENCHFQRMVVEREIELSTMYNEQDRDAQRRQIEQKMDRTRQEIDRMRVASAAVKLADVERQYKALLASFNDKTIPRDFASEQAGIAKGIVQTTASKACDNALNGAREAAMMKNDKEKNKLIAIAREALKKAMEMGAEDGMREIVQKKIDIISETGGNWFEGPTKAKPGEATPKMVNFAKQERRGHKRFTEPTLVVQIGETKCTSFNWSIGGLLIQGLPGKLPVGYELQIEFGLEGGIKHPATVRVMRIEELETGNRFGVRFLRSTRAGFEFFQTLLRTHGERG